MPATVTVNRLTVVHKDSGGVANAFPDVCKTPAPAGPPIPLPYPNVAMSTDTAGGSSTVKIDGNPIMLKSSYFAVSTGDEAGSAFGVVSNKVKGKAYPKMYSFDVKVEGEPVFRQTDIMCQNGGSPTNTPPAAELQAPLMSSMPDDADYKAPEVTAIRWSKPEVVCGDRVTLEIVVANMLSSGLLSVDVVRQNKDESLQSAVDMPIKNGSNTIDWISKQGLAPWEPEPKSFAEQLTFRGVETSEPIKFKVVQDTKQLIGPFMRSTPEYQKIRSGVWARTGRNYSWDVCYEASIRQGSFRITRKIDFVTHGAVTPALHTAKWKREIENVWNDKFKLHREACQRGDRCACFGDPGCCVFPIHVHAEFGPGHGQSVDLHAGEATGPWGSTAWWYSHTWWELVRTGGPVPDHVRAHEFGHLIGMYDEYPEGACDPLRQHTNGQNIMGYGSQAEAHHFKEFMQWFEANTTTVLGKLKLRAK